MERNIYLIFWVLIGIVFPFSTLAQQGLTFVTVDNFPPYTWQRDGKSFGIDVEIIQGLSKRSGIPITIRHLPAKRVVRMTKIGEADGAFAAFKTPAREAIAQFVGPPLHFSTYQIFVKKGEEFSFNAVRDLYGKAIGKNRGFHISEEFKKAAVDNKIQLFEVSTMEQNIGMLNKGRINAFVGNQQEVAFILKNLKLSGKIVPLPQPVRTPQAAYLMISKAAEIKKKTIRHLNQVLLNMKADGALETVYKKYGK